MNCCERLCNGIRLMTDFGYVSHTKYIFLDNVRVRVEIFANNDLVGFPH